MSWSDARVSRHVLTGCGCGFSHTCGCMSWLCCWHLLTNSSKGSGDLGDPKTGCRLHKPSTCRCWWLSVMSWWWFCSLHSLSRLCSNLGLLQGRSQWLLNVLLLQGRLRRHLRSPLLLLLLLEGRFE